MCQGEENTPCICKGLDLIPASIKLLLIYNPIIIVTAIKRT